MYVSARSEYALLALTTLATEGRPMTLEELARRHGLPPAYLAVVLRLLRQARIVAVERGRLRGYRLIGNPHEITAAAVVRVVDGLWVELPAVRSGPSGRQGLAESALVALWQTVQDSVETALDAVTIAELPLLGDSDRSRPSGIGRVSPRVGLG